jgi:hydroxyacylglutathione hydrolase
MLVKSFEAAAFGTNCYVLAAGPGEPCVIVDPGIGVVTNLDALLLDDGLRPAAVCDARGITAYVHPGDRQMLADPAKGLSAGLTEMFGGRLEYSEPEDVALLPDGGVINVAGLELTVDHAPGHTRGSVLFRFSTPDEEACLSGDVLFAGSIGRTDLPGGSMDEMIVSLRDKILTLDDDIVVLPGHGPATTIGRERRSNPYLLEVGQVRPQTRGL